MRSHPLTLPIETYGTSRERERKRKSHTHLVETQRKREREWGHDEGKIDQRKSNFCAAGLSICFPAAAVAASLALFL